MKIEIGTNEAGKYNLHFGDFRVYALTASRASVATLAIFASLRAAKTLVGEPPQTRLWDKLSQSLLSASPLLIAPVPYFCAGRSHPADGRYWP